MATGETTKNLDELHTRAEAMVTSFKYEKPPSLKGSKGIVRLCKGDFVRADVQVVKGDGGENNLHYHTNGDSFWLVLKGRVRFYGPDNKVTGEYGPMEGTITPCYSRYWFENAGEEDLELLHVSARGANRDILKTGYVNLQPEQKQHRPPEDIFVAAKR